MHEGVFFSSKLKFHQGGYEDWLEKPLNLYQRKLKLPEDLASLHDIEESLGGNPTIKDFLDFVRAWRDRGEEFCDFSYDPTRRTFSMKVYLTTVRLFDAWMAAFALLIAASMSVGAKGYGVFVNDVGVTTVSCHYLFLVENEELKTLFYDFYDTREQWKPFRKVWSKKILRRWSILSMGMPASRSTENGELSIKAEKLFLNRSMIL